MISIEASGVSKTQDILYCMLRRGDAAHSKDSPTIEAHTISLFAFQITPTSTRTVAGMMAGME